MSGDPSDGGGVSSHPPLRLVRGDATAEEVAAIVAVLASVDGGADDTPAAGRRASRWAAPAGRVRPAVHPGPGAWRAVSLPH